MLRPATSADIAFISELIAAGAETGVFDRQLAQLAPRRGFELELKSIISTGRRTTGESACVCIWQPLEIPIGFLAISAMEGNQFTQLWLAAVASTHWRQGHFQAMIDPVLVQAKGEGKALFALCSQEAEVAYRVLLRNGFRQIDMTKSGNRVLAFNL